MRLSSEVWFAIVSMLEILIVIGELYDQVGLAPGHELWRVPFLGWGEWHSLTAATMCRPKRYEVLDEARGMTAAAGDTNHPLVLPGEVFIVRIEAPSA